VDAQGFFAQALVYLGAAVIAVPLARRLGLGSVLGYLLAGVAIGPFALKLVGRSEDVMHFAEFGVVMMLFVIGLELQPAMLWRMRGPIFGLGLLQMASTALLIAAVTGLFGMPPLMAIATGLILAMSSTAIALQSLQERGLMRSDGGRASFSVLLFQDIAVIPILALLPLLATQAPAAHGGGHGPAAAATGWMQGLLVIGVVAGIVVGGRFLLRPVFRWIAGTRLRDAFTATALLLVVGIAMAMTAVGLSPALGTFLAGVVLADSEYRHELESDLEPFKGLLLGLFFISVGASIDFGLIVGAPWRMAGFVALLVAVKLVLLLALGRRAGQPWPQAWLFAATLAQGGEFAFVLIAFALQTGVFPRDVAGTLTGIVALSMVVAPLLLLANDRLIQPRFARGEGEREMDRIDEGSNPVLVAGFGRFGQVVGRMLKANGIGATVLDLDAESIELLRKYGLKVFYGDASRTDLLHAAGAEQARLMVLAVDDPGKSLSIAEAVRRHYPHLRILARANNLRHAFALRRLGVDATVTETWGSALALGETALREVGFAPYQAHRAALRFRRHEGETMAALFDAWGDEAARISVAKQRVADLEHLLESDDEEARVFQDSAWESAPRVGAARDSE